jgi:hypothetical protein
VSDDVIGTVRGYLERSGFPFELEVARRMRASGFSVDHHQHYTDEDEGKIREIDLIGRLTLGGVDARLVLNIVVECKYIGGSPWVAITEDRSSPTTLTNGNTAANDHGGNLLSNLPHDLRLSRFWNGPGPTAFGTVAVTSHRKEDEKTAKSSRVDAETAPVDIARAARAIQNGRSNHRSPLVQAILSGLNGGWAEIWVPIVVVKGVLTTAWLGKDDKIHVERTSPWARLRVQPPRVRAETVVDIVEDAHFPEYLATAVDDMLLIEKAVEREPKLVLESALARYLESTRAAPAAPGDKT